MIDGVTPLPNSPAKAAFHAFLKAAMAEQDGDVHLPSHLAIVLSIHLPMRFWPDWAFDVDFVDMDTYILEHYPPAIAPATALRQRMGDTSDGHIEYLLREATTRHKETARLMQETGRSGWMLDLASLVPQLAATLRAMQAERKAASNEQS